MAVVQGTSKDMCGKKEEEEKRKKRHQQNITRPTQLSVGGA